MTYTIDEIKNKLTPIFEQNGILKAVLFGSYAKGEATEQSDVDIVAHVDDEMSIFDFAEISGFVEDALGKKVDFLYGYDVIPGGKVDVELQKDGVILYAKM